MKKILFVLLILATATIGINAGEVVTPDAQKLPAEAREFITKHFSDAKVSYIKIENEFLKGKSYEVVLTNGAELEFDAKGRWTEVDCKRVAVPAAIIPQKVKDYVKQHFASNFITQIEQGRRGLEVELDNDLSVEFDKNGNFKRLDD